MRFNLLYIEDVITDEGDKTFTKGNIYKAYESTYRDNYDVIDCLRTRNDNNESHIIKELSGDRLDNFYNKHFVKIK